MLAVTALGLALIARLICVLVLLRAESLLLLARLAAGLVGLAFHGPRRDLLLAGLVAGLVGLRVWGLLHDTRIAARLIRLGGLDRARALPRHISRLWPSVGSRALVWRLRRHRASALHSRRNLTVPGRGGSFVAAQALGGAAVQRPPRVGLQGFAARREGNRRRGRSVAHHHGAVVKT